MNTTPTIQFTDGAAYERYMGIWSRMVGAQFLHWLSAVDGMRWLDVGCGNGAFTEMLAQHGAPSALAGIDPSAEQLAFARTLPSLAGADLRAGDAMALPFADNSFDAAVMPLVIFFVPEPRRGVTEMARVVAPGGLVTAYAWDMPGGGFPYAALQAEMRALGAQVAMPPSADASCMEILQELWRDAGLAEIQSREITVHRSFANFDDYWTTILGGPSVAASMTTLTEEARAALKTRMQELLPPNTKGEIVISAKANAISGAVAL